MKNKIIIGIITLIIMSGWGCIVHLIVSHYKDSKEIIPEIEEVIILHEQIDTDEAQRQDEVNWDKFIDELIYVESKGNENIIGTKNDRGVLQITPIMLKEFNRIIGYDKYVHDDCFSCEISIEIFNMVQSHHNPDKCPHLALKIWNSKAHLSYHTKVMNKYSEYDCN